MTYASQESSNGRPINQPASVKIQYDSPFYREKPAGSATDPGINTIAICGPWPTRALLCAD